ncbi:MAG: hypothetical protein JNL98_16195 [Bryobacterales bacterium]|nr:hypothetical protein [Bryobacterales bacterium]
MPIAIAQPVQVNATGTINNQARYVIGTATNGIAVEFLPTVQTVDPSSAGFSVFNLLQVRVTVTGNPFVNPLDIGDVPYSVVVTHGGAGGTLSGMLSMTFGPGRPVLSLMGSESDVAVLDGVAYSWNRIPVRIGTLLFRYRLKWTCPYLRAPAEPGSG